MTVPPLGTQISRLAALAPDERAVSSVQRDKPLHGGGERLAAYEVPRIVEFVDFPVRDDAGNARRTAACNARITRVRVGGP